MFKKFIVDNIITSGSNVFIGVLNWIFTYLLLKYSGVDVANSFLALMSVFLVATIPATATSYIINKIGSKSIDYLRNYFKWVVGLICIYFVILAISCWLLKFDLQLTLTIYLLIIISFVGNYYKALLQHYLLFKQYSLISVIEVVLKIIVLVLFIKFESAAITSLFVQLIISASLSWYFIKTKAPKFELESLQMFDIGVLLTAVVFTASIVVYTSIDSILGKYSLTSIDYNNYQKLLQISKVLIFFCSGINLVLIPTLERDSDGRENFRFVLIAIIVEIFCTIFGVIFIAIFQSKIFEIFSLSIPVSSVIIFVIAAGIYSISQTFSVLAFKINRWKIMLTVFILVTIVQVFLFVNSHTIYGYIFATLISAVMNLMLYVYFQYKQILKYFLNK